MSSATYVKASEFDVSKLSVRGGSAQYAYADGKTGRLRLLIENAVMHKPRVYDGKTRSFVEFASTEIPKELKVTYVKANAKLSEAGEQEQAVLAVQSALMETMPETTDSSLACSMYGIEVGISIELKGTNAAGKDVKIENLMDVKDYSGVRWAARPKFTDDDGRQVEAITHLGGAAAGVRGDFVIEFDKAREKDGKAYISVSLVTAQGGQVTEVAFKQTSIGGFGEGKRRKLNDE